MNEAAINSPEWKKSGGEFIPYPASWLNARGWEDELPQSNVQTDKAASIIAKYPQGTPQADMTADDRRELLKLWSEKEKVAA